MIEKIIFTRLSQLFAKRVGYLIVDTGEWLIKNLNKAGGQLIEPRNFRFFKQFKSFKYKKMNTVGESTNKKLTLGESRQILN